MNDSAALGVQLGINGAGPFGRRPEEDLPGVLEIVAKLGYDGAEIHPNAWYDGVAAVRRAFAETGLILAAVHVFEADIASADQCGRLLDGVAAAGGTRVILTAHDKRTEADFRLLAGELALLAQAGVDSGIAAYYHPHDADFRPLPDAPSRRGIDVVADTTDPAALRFNLDIYWIHVGGADPIEAIRHFGGRCDYYHVKDGDPRRSSPLGFGQVPVPECLTALHRPPAFVDWIVYEDPQPQLPPTALCRAAKDYLRGHGFTGRRAG